MTDMIRREMTKMPEFKMMKTEFADNSILLNSINEIQFQFFRFLQFSMQTKNRSFETQ